MSDNKIMEEDIVSMLDQFMANGGGHMNVDVNALQGSLEKQVQESPCSDCNSKTMACQIPTLHEGLDTNEP